MSTFRRVVCIVLDGVGVGAAPDAADYNDAGANSVGNTARAVGSLQLPNLARMGFGNITGVGGVAPVERATAHHGRMCPASAGKDSTTGHWELMGCILKGPFPTYPDGFPPDIIDSFERSIGRATIGNRAASGTAIIAQLGEEHISSGRPIVYTSADSVFQIAAHEDSVSIVDLYAMCEAARGILCGPHAVGRVIARPFAGAPGSFYRTPRRRDFSLVPPEETVLDGLVENGLDVVTIGKIDDLFAGRGITASVHTRDNADGMRCLIDALARREGDLVFVNLVDFDTMWGHRGDARAYALGLEEFDSFLAQLIPALDDSDLLLITADHGNDPTAQSTDHSREYVPLLAFHAGVDIGCDLGTRRSLADVGATVAEVLGGDWSGPGESFVSRL